jgi:uncharacterized membrane protein YgaE (UPF0421/DUF939 family)
MSINFNKILDFLEPTYAQLRNMLFITISSICAVYFIGVKTANFQNITNETNKLTKENTVMITEMKIQMNENQRNTSTDISKLYTDILDMNIRNNEFWNNKFNILIKYGNTNKNLLMDMLKMQDEQQKLYEQDRLKNMEYWGITRPDLPDSLKIKAIKVN